MATFDPKTIVMMAENGHSVEIDGKKIQMTIVQEAVEAKPDYSHLVGKWVKVLVREYESWDKRIQVGKWIPIHSTRKEGFWFFNHDFWLTHDQVDLSNPLDHNPDEVRVFDVPSEIRIVGGAYELGLCFGEHQYLWYNKARNCYGVATDGKGSRFIPCIATECKFEDLKEGDLFFATNNKKPDLTKLIGYKFLNANGEFVRVYQQDISVVYYTYTHYFKITPKP